ncbi:hypothetical protein Goarm_020118, partial [Gossypium armourianum]|nr:hypothetical protein [Gossypium armourianum]
MEETCEIETRRLWESSSGHVTDRLAYLYGGLQEWADKLKYQRAGNSKKLLRRIDQLDAMERTEENLVELIDVKMHLNITVKYSIVLNGEEGEIISPSRGLKQGDPLSPCLFLICSEGLSTLMRLAENDGLPTGAKILEAELMHNTFNDDVADRILCIPLARAPHEDKLVQRREELEVINQKIHVQRVGPECWRPPESPLGLDLSFSEVEIEGDALTVIKKLISEKE